MSISRHIFQVNFIINKWKVNVLNNSISSNAVRLSNMKQEFNKVFIEKSTYRRFLLIILNDNYLIRYMINVKFIITYDVTI